ncbi:MAG: hypothetical protein F6K28_15840 [Microcoleus sp. SIO2G3]|nr:hypothetical protein [Microcoleus sp. SIO2G3]
MQLSTRNNAPALKLYWNSLKRNRNKCPVLVFYASSTEPYSEAFLSDLSKFGGAICVVTSPPTPLLRGEGSKNSSGSPSSLQGEGVRGWGSLQFFPPSQAIADVVQWIREKVPENKRPQIYWSAYGRIEECACCYFTHLLFCSQR